METRSNDASPQMRQEPSWFERRLGKYWVTLALSGLVGILLIGVAFYGAVNCCASISPAHAWMVAAVAAVLGWGGAMLVAPYSAEDEMNFQRVTRVVAAFAGGFSLAKIGELFSTVTLKHLTEPRLMLVGLAMVSFAVFAIVTYTFRVYGIPDETKAQTS